MSEAGTANTNANTNNGIVDLQKKTLTVKWPREGDGANSYEFRIPSLHDEIRIGGRIKDLRKRLDPSWDGMDQGLDGGTFYVLKVCATFELCLVATSAPWPFTANQAGTPVVDSSKFPDDKVDEAFQIYAEFQNLLNTFRSGRA